MGCIRVDKMVDYLGEPLRKTLKVTPLTLALSNTRMNLHM